MRKPIILALALVVTLGGLLAACGDDDGADVRSSGEASGSGSGSGAGSGSGSGTTETACAPVGEDLEADADETVEVQLLDYAFAPPEIAVAPGVVTFATTNDGTENHELAFLPGGDEVPVTDDGAPDEEALADAGAFELEGYSPGQSCNATYDLEPGTYTLFCIVEAPDGETHYQKGMAGVLTVG